MSSRRPGWVWAQADLLSDRIAIMTAGKMACMGSSVFLKKRFGLGFSLTMVKTNDQVNLALRNKTCNDPVFGRGSFLALTYLYVAGKQRPGGRGAGAEAGRVAHRGDEATQQRGH